MSTRLKVSMENGCGGCEALCDTPVILFVLFLIEWKLIFSKDHIFKILTALKLWSTDTQIQVVLFRISLTVVRSNQSINKS